MMPQKRAWGRVLLGGRRSRIGCLWCLTSRPIPILTRSGSNARRGRRQRDAVCPVLWSAPGPGSAVDHVHPATGLHRRRGMVLSAYAEQVAIAIEHARLLAAEEERTAVLERTNLILRDEITERQRIEAERERLLAEQEARNAEMERFTYTVSHDLKSPHYDPRLLGPPRAGCARGQC